MKPLLMFALLASCGTSKLLPPNTELACSRAVKCEAVASDDWGQCVTCLEHTDPAKLDAINEYLKDNPIESLPCDRLRGFVVLSNLPQCIAMHWVWTAN